MTVFGGVFIVYFAKEGIDKHARTCYNEKDVEKR